VNQDIIFQPGVYNFSSGIIVNHSIDQSLTLDCNGAVILGNQSLTGINIIRHQNINKPLIIKNCIVTNYSIGIYSDYYVGGAPNPNNISILNNKVYNTTLAGIAISDATAGGISGNNMVDCGLYGIYVDHAIGILIMNNSAAKATDSAFYIYYSDNVTSIDNTAKESKYGFYIKPSTSVNTEFTLINNRLLNNTVQGVYILASTSLSSTYRRIKANLIDNTFENNTLTLYNLKGGEISGNKLFNTLLYIRNSNSTIIKYNDLDGSNLNGYNLGNITIDGNTIHHNKANSIYLSNVDNSLLENNKIFETTSDQSNPSAVRFSNCEYITSRNNELIDSDIGFYISGSSDNTFSSNNIERIESYAFLLSRSENNKVDYNEIDDADYGILLYSSNNNFTGNKIFNSNTGVYMNSNYSYFSNNEFKHNGRSIRLSDSSVGHIFEDNSFCDPTDVDIDVYNVNKALNYGYGNACDKPGNFIWLWSDNGTKGCSHTCDYQNCDELRPASQQGFNLINYTDDNWRVNFLSWIRDSSRSDYVFDPVIEFFPHNAENMSWKSVLEYELNVPPNKNRLVMALGYYLSGGTENSVNFSTEVLIYNFRDNLWETAYSDSDMPDDNPKDKVVSINLLSKRIEDGKVRLKVTQINEDTDGPTGSWSAYGKGGEGWHGTISLDRFTHQFCSEYFPPSCDDGIKNQNEQGVDCGGQCKPCVSCHNRIKDGNEEGVDCGGSCAYPCSQLKILALPLNWEGTQEEFENMVNTQIDYFINSTELNSCRESVRVDISNITEYNFENFSCTKKDCGVKQIKPFVESLGINVKNYDHIVAFTESSPCYPIMGCSNGKDAVWVTTTYDWVAAHELGHCYGLEDEYCSNQAGSNDPRCNDGGEWWWMGPIPMPATDKNQLDASLGCDPYVGDCCSDCSSDGNDYGSGDYFVCCEGNINSLGGRGIMSYANADEPRAFDDYSKSHLDTFTKLQCQAEAQSIKSFSMQAMVDNKIIDLDLLIHKNDTVEKRWIHLVDGTPSVASGGEGQYSLLVKDVNNNTMFNYTFDAFFDYDGPVVKGENYSGINLDSYELSLKIGYDDEMNKVELWNGSDLLFMELLDFCNKDSVCNGSETYLSCWDDCSAWSTDGLCINEIDQHCDPDCAEDIDLDCSAFTMMLNQGWNLISSPLNFTNLTEVFLPIQPYFEAMYNFDAEEQEFLQLDPYTFDGDLDLRYGAWIKVSQDTNLSIRGEEFSSNDVPLSVGWNLIGVPSLTALNLSTWLNASVVYGYNGSYYSYVPNRTSNMFEMAEPGKGYWVKAG